MRNYLPFPHFFSVPSTAFHPHALFCFPVGNIWVGWRVVTHGVCVCLWWETSGILPASFGGLSAVRGLGALVFKAALRHYQTLASRWTSGLDMKLTLYHLLIGQKNKSGSSQKDTRLTLLLTMWKTYFFVRDWRHLKHFNTCPPSWSTIGGASGRISKELSRVCGVQNVFLGDRG